MALATYPSFFPHLVRSRNMRRSTRSRRSVRPRRRLRRVARRRRVIRRRGTRSRRSLLNITSVKKRDNMATWIPNASGTPGGAGSFGNLGIPATGGFVNTLFCPSARSLDQVQLTSFPTGPQWRERASTYSVGYKETTVVRLAGGAPMRWRRIVFHVKDLRNRYFAFDPLGTTDYYTLLNTSGYVRQTTPVSGTLQAVLWSLIFEGAQAVTATSTGDWNDPFLAKVDTARISLISDKTHVFNPGNATGQVRTFKQYYPTKKTLLYEDDEAEEDMNPSRFATTSKVGMGDLYVFDLFQYAVSDANSASSVSHEGTYYWHER